MIPKLTATRLLEEIKRGSELASQSLMQHGLPKSLTKITHETLFRAATENGHTSIVHILIQKGCSLIPDSLHIAVNQKNLTLVHLLLRYFISADIVYNGETPLQCAVKAKAKDIILLLVSWNANWRIVSPEGKTLLHLAIEKNGTVQEIIEILNVFIANGLEVDARTKIGMTPLLYAARRCMPAVVEYLLLRNANIRACDNKGNSVLHHMIVNIAQGTVNRGYYALEDKQQEIRISEYADWLISKGAFADSKNLEGETPTYLAIKYSKLIILSRLLLHRPDVNVIGEDGKTMMHHLVSHQSRQRPCDILETAEYLKMIIQCGAKFDVADDFGDTPLHLAAKNNQRTLLKLMLQGIGNVNIPNNDGKTILYLLMEENNGKKGSSIDKTTLTEIVQMLIMKGAKIDVIDKNGDTPIHVAARNKLKDVMWILLENFNHVNTHNSNKETLLHILAGTDDQCDKVIEILASKGAVVDFENKENLTPLHIAAKHKHPHLIETLIKLGADARLLANDGFSILHLLLSGMKNVDEDLEANLIQLFIRQGVNVNGKTNAGVTTLHMAVRSGRARIVKLLIEYGAYVNCVEMENLQTPLHMAVEKNFKDIVEMLLNSGADVNAKKKHGKTALHIVSCRENPATLLALISSGADIDAKDANKRTALHYACGNKNVLTLGTLISNGGDINATDYFGKVPLIFSSSNKEIRDKITLQVIRLDAANMFVHAGNRQNANSYGPLCEFYNGCLDEAKRLKNIKIDIYTSLFDVLHMNPNDLAAYEKNFGFKQIVFAADFRAKYPCYYDMIFARYRIGLLRSGLMQPSKEAARQLMGISVPDECFKNIFKYLSNDDLRALIHAHGITFKKRELNKREMESTQKQRRFI